MSRRAEIADAAISTLARDGMRGLTHRAVDRAAGLPDGSVSYYFRTRRALLQATLERLVELDITDMLASPGIPAQPGRGLDAFADTTAIAVESWLTAGRERQLARYELTLEATRRPALAEALSGMVAATLDVAIGEHRALGLDTSPAQVQALITLFSGVLLTLAAGPPEAVTPNATGALARCLVAGVLATVPGVPTSPPRRVQRRGHADQPRLDH